MIISTLSTSGSEDEKNDPGYSSEIARILCSIYAAVAKENYSEIGELTERHMYQEMSVRQHLRMHYMHGIYYQWKRDFEQILHSAQAAFPYAGKINDLAAYVTIAMLAASACHNLQKFDQAHDYFLQAQSHLKLLKLDQKDQGMEEFAIVKGLAIEAFHLVKYEDSQMYLDLAQKLVRYTKPWKQNSASIAWVSALILRYQGKLREAEKYISLAEELYDPAQNPLEWGRLHVAKAEIILDVAFSEEYEQNSPEMQEVEQAVLQTLHYTEAAVDIHGQGMAKLAMARFQRLNRKNVQFASFLAGAETIAEELSDHIILCNIYTERAYFFDQMNDPANALYWYTRALDESKKCEAPVYGIRALREILKKQEEQS